MQTDQLASADLTTTGQSAEVWMNSVDGRSILIYKTNCSDECVKAGFCVFILLHINDKVVISVGCAHRSKQLLKSIADPQLNYLVV